MLEVRIAEVSRSVTKRFSANILAFNPLSGDFFFSLLGGLVNPTGTVFGASQNAAGGWNNNVGLNPDGVPISPKTGYMFGGSSGNTRILGFLDILKQNGLAKILAEPNLVATSGQTAEFLAGGEYPVPVPQRDSITIEYKRFGVMLKFTPEVLPGGRIKLKVAPEVSELDFSTAVVVEGYTVPGITTRRAQTELELKDGQSFAMAGLFRDDITDGVSKVPWLGDIPVLGALFRSTEFRSKRTELVIVVTPRIVRGDIGKPGDLPTDGVTLPGTFARFFCNQMTTISGRKAPAPSKAPDASSKAQPVKIGPPSTKSGIPRVYSEMEGRFGNEVIY